MSWRDGLLARPMQRVAIVVPADGRARDILAAVAAAGVIELDEDPAVRYSDTGPAAAALDTRRQAGTRGEPDTQASRGAQSLERVRATMIDRGPVAAIAGWCPAESVTDISGRLAPMGGAVVRIRPRKGIAPPTLTAPSRITGAFQPLVETYGTVPYPDLNPGAFAGLSYIFMFGMMFGDVGHGLLLIGLGVLARLGRPALLGRLRHLSVMVIGAGVAGVLFGFAYGEAFGPTGLVPVLWIRPLDHPTTLIASALAVGVGLLCVSYAWGTANRWREGGPRSALVALTGVAGSCLYASLGFGAMALYLRQSWLLLLGAVLGAGGLVLGAIGSLPPRGGGPGRLLEPCVELFDAVIRIGSNIFSFARLAAFGLTHAALGQIIWAGSVAIFHLGPLFWLLGATILIVGNALAFSLEGLVAGTQALRLEYYELFSRIFTTQGRPFRPWRIPLVAPEVPSPANDASPAIAPTEEALCTPG